MPDTGSQQRKERHKRTAVRTVLVYAAFASLWIYFSDQVLALFIKDPALMTQLQTIKGLLFVLITTGLLYLYLSHCLHALRIQEDALTIEQDNAQQNLREHFKQLNTIFDSMNAIVYVADIETYDLLFVNSFAEDFFGQGWEGRKCYDFLQKGIDRPCAFCTNSRLLDNGKPGKPVVWEFCNTSNQRWYECFDKAIYWTDNRLVRLEVAMDITERKGLEQIKDDLLSSMSHEMRTPLTAVSGFAELLLNETGLPKEHKRHVEIIHREAEKLAELINKFLDMRRLKINRARVDYEQILVSSLLEQAKKKYSDCKESHELKITCDPDALVYGNRKELMQAICQLLENACRYSPAGGEISLWARRDELGTTISIKDQGIGIPQHEIESIFQPFHMLDTGNSRSTSGVGLGLYVAKEIVDLHGGQIKVESTPGQGSTFIILLPAPGNHTNISDNGQS
jgi:PAS domain-containing protein/anti-sigma regulatory factor (Ser/Thr protein kinase)